MCVCILNVNTKAKNRDTMFKEHVSYSSFYGMVWLSDGWMDGWKDRIRCVCETQKPPATTKSNSGKISSLTF